MQGLLSCLGWVPPGGPAVWEVPMHPWEPLATPECVGLIGSDRPGPVLEADGVICMQVTSYADKSPPTFSPNCALGQPNACCATAGGDGCYR